MMKYKNIVCAVDLSDDERKIVLKAADLAKKYRAKLTLLHVIMPPELLSAAAIPSAGPVWIPSTEFDLSSDSDENNSLANDAQGRLKTLCQLTDMDDVSHEVTFNHNASDAICNYLESNDTDLAVVGCYGKHGFISLFTSTTAEKVINKAPCDIYVVRID